MSAQLLFFNSQKYKIMKRNLRSPPSFPTRDHYHASGQPHSPPSRHRSPLARRYTLLLASEYRGFTRPLLEVEQHSRVLIVAAKHHRTRYPRLSCATILPRFQRNSEIRLRSQQRLPPGMIPATSPTLAVRAQLSPERDNYQVIPGMMVATSSMLTVRA